MTQAAEKTCMECHKPINGRSDKKFCDDGCRNAYNNRKNSDADALVKSINMILRKNRTILRELLSGSEKTTVPEKSLKSAGFNFEYFTHLYETRTGTVYKFCYELGYLRLDGAVYMLVKRQARK
jgi:predicted nucleic acid-binding Zn ribbon protein